jgi:hypothetical protein
LSSCKAKDSTDAHVVFAFDVHMMVVQEHAEYSPRMKNAGIVIRRHVGAYRVGLGSEVDG